VVVALILEEVLRGINGVVTQLAGGLVSKHNTSIAALERLMHVPLQHYQQDAAKPYMKKEYWRPPGG